MLLNTEELLALANGDAEPDRLADLLDRLDHCPESAEALQVLVTLRANREEALKALREAADNDFIAAPIPHPATWRASFAGGWLQQGLRLAASVAIVALISVWAATSFFGVGEPVDTTTLATTSYRNIVGPGMRDAELTTGNQQAIVEAHDALERGDYETARMLLEGLPSDDSGRIPLYLGMSYYFLGDYRQALEEFTEVQRLEGVESTLQLQQATWYEANALVALDRSTEALIALERAKSHEGYPFHDDAVALHQDLREALGMSRPRHDN